MLDLLEIPRNEWILSKRNVPVARCDFRNVRLCSHGSSKTQCLQWVGKAPGTDVVTNLIDRHV